MKQKHILIGLVLIIILLVGFFVFNFAKNNYQEKVYNQCVTDMAGIIINNLQTNGYVDIFVGNQTIRLVPLQQNER